VKQKRPKRRFNVRGQVCDDRQDARNDTARVETKLDIYVKEWRGEAKATEREIQRLENRQASLELYGILGGVKQATLTESK